MSSKADETSIATHFARIAALEAARDNWKKDLSPDEIAFQHQLKVIDRRISQKYNINYRRYQK